MNGHLSFYECRFNGGDTLGGGDTQTLSYAKEFVQTFLHS